MVFKSIDHRKQSSICFFVVVVVFFTIKWKAYERNWLNFLLRKRALHVASIFIICTLIENRHEPISAQDF